MTRLLLPLILLGVTACLLLYAAQDALRPQIDVVVAAVVPRPSLESDATDGAASEATTSPNGAPSPGMLLVQAPGWIEAAPHAIGVPALAEGVVREILVLEGDLVEAGQVVLRMIDDDARLAVRAAEAALEAGDADIERAEAAVAVAEQSAAMASAQRAGLVDEVRRKRDLVALGGVTAAEFRDLEARLEVAEARIASAHASIAEARAGVRQARAARLAAEVGLDEARLALERMAVVAPSAGVVLARMVEPGYRVTMAAKHGEGAGGVAGAVMTLYDPGRLQVRVEVPLADAARIELGTRAQVTTEALPDVEFRGSVVRVLHEANIQRNTVQCKVEIESPSPVLVPGMLARVRFVAQARSLHRQDGLEAPSGMEGFLLLLPQAALLAGTGDQAQAQTQAQAQAQAQVWLVDSTSGAPRAVRREVVVERWVEPGWVIVRRGLRPTDRVVLEAPASLREGSRLRIIDERPGGAGTSSSPSSAP